MIYKAWREAFRITWLVCRYGRERAKAMVARDVANQMNRFREEVRDLIRRGVFHN